MVGTCAFLKPTLEQTHSVFAANIITSVLEFFIAITATGSNALIIYVIWKNKALHSPSNTLLGCLAVTDLLVGSLAAPLNILTKLGEMVNNEDIYCVAGVMNSFTGNTSGTSTFLILGLISVERYLAIRLHLRYATTITIKKILRVVTILWLFVISLASLRFWDTKEVFFRPVLIMGTALSTGVVVFCYGNIFLHVRRHRQQILNHVSVSMNTRNKKVCINNSINSEERKTMVRQKKSTLTMVYILLFFFLCYFPALVYQVVAATAMRTGEHSQSLRIAYRIVFTLVELNSSLNPVLYCLRITELREAVVKVVKKPVKRRRDVTQ